MSHHTVPQHAEPFRWLVFLGHFSEIPMDQIVRILQLKFRQPYDPVQTQRFYEGLVDHSNPSFENMIKGGSAGVVVQAILMEAEILRAQIVMKEE
ncbi:MAG: hypothetical protein LQ349_002482 [Xanthoria aureola]|nr:MAG: hypothetical protein LQ349_002482 [Xanthoria aureola]